MVVTREIVDSFIVRRPWQMGTIGITALSPRSLRTDAVRAPYDVCEEAAETARTPHDVRAISAPEGPYDKSHDARAQCEHKRHSP